MDQISCSAVRHYANGVSQCFAATLGKVPGNPQSKQSVFGSALDVYFGYQDSSNSSHAAAISSSVSACTNTSGQVVIPEALFAQINNLWYIKRRLRILLNQQDLLNSHKPVIRQNSIGSTSQTSTALFDDPQDEADPSVPVVPETDPDLMFETPSVVFYQQQAAPNTSCPSPGAQEQEHGFTSTQNRSEAEEALHGTEDVLMIIIADTTNQIAAAVSQIVCLSFLPFLCTCINAVLRWSHPYRDLFCVVARNRVFFCCL